MAMEAYQYVVRTRHSPPSIENPIAETLKTFNRSGVVNAEPDVGIACQHRLPFLVFQGACRNKEIHWPSGFFSKRLKQLHPLLRNNPEQRIGYEVDFRPKLFEHRGSGAKVHCQQRLSFYKLRSFLHRTAQRSDRWPVSAALPDYRTMTVNAYATWTAAISSPH